MKSLDASFAPPRFLTNDFAGTRLICFATVTILACLLQGTPSESTGSGHALLDTVAIIAIGIAVWHGAYDGVLARPRFEPRLGAWWATAFASGYLALIGVTLVAWHVAPAYTLVAFLAYSSWHFGSEQDSKPMTLGASVSAFALGALPVAAACHWHPDQVDGIFQAMLGPGARPMFSLELTRACAALLWPIVAVAVAGTSLGLRGTAQATRLTLLALVALELGLFRSCDPLLAFAVYFCVWHTPEHLVSTSFDETGSYNSHILMQNLRAGILPWIVSLAGLAVLFAFRPYSLTGYASALFVLLSALTVPHMALNEMRRMQAPA